MVKNDPGDGLNLVNQPMVIWNKSADVSLQKAYDYIRETSPTNQR